MATRKKTASSRSSRKKTTAGAAKKKATRKAATKKASARKTAAKSATSRTKSTASKTSRSSTATSKATSRAKATSQAQATAAAPKPRKAAAPKPPPPSPVELLAEKIVAMTLGEPEDFDPAALYNDDCISREPRGEPAHGFEGLAAKVKQWSDLQKRSTWCARNVFVKGDTVCIEWEAQVELRDGRVLDFEEVAIHKVRDGKIAEEHYYYDPSVFEPPAVSEDEVAAPPPEPAVPRPTARPVERTGTPPVDPIDL